MVGLVVSFLASSIASAMSLSPSSPSSTLRRHAGQRDSPRRPYTPPRKTHMSTCQS